MNRSILIVICDFLLVSLLVFSTPDMSKVNSENSEQSAPVTPATTQVDSKQDLGIVMRQALDEERKNRDLLVQELKSTRDTVAQKEALVNERDQQVKSFQQSLQTREQEAKQLQDQQTKLRQQFATAQSNIQTLNSKLQSNTVENLLSKEALAAMQADANKQIQDAAALQAQLAQLQKSNQMVLTEKQQLANQLQVAEAEKRSATQQVAFMQDQVKAEREEKAKLADNVKVLANKSVELAHEIRDNRPLAPNTIYNQFVSNRVTAAFYAFKPGFIVDANRRRETDTVLVTNGTNTYALCHVQDTPLVFRADATDWQSLTGTFLHNGAVAPISSLSFSLEDPRIVLIPVRDAEARQLGCKIYHLSSDPFKFQDAVVVGTRDNYYGECKFQMDLSMPDYVKMDHSSLKGLFGKFNPSRGDLVFSKNGELLGVMANNTYCTMLKSFSPITTLEFSENMKSQRVGDTLARLYGLVLNMPLKLQ
ncbi:hypothetical protein [Pedosphaera parvula]|uniref:Uncharacterized protein n=1 Tax=Pedosphaera parvula (strain Ellin514) TaxID=320771 RepID=B9XK16_PEDPL|nr:hypothetical protein [Pedosphaera parvula]EEF59839.1 conserved hypothetical protein [Pedosphaera parvula Ellin514]